MKRGTLYGVGLGPGAADLMTLRALDCLRKVDCIILPRKDEKAHRYHGTSPRNRSV